MVHEPQVEEAHQVLEARHVVEALHSSSRSKPSSMGMSDIETPYMEICIGTLYNEYVHERRDTNLFCLQQQILNLA